MSVFYLLNIPILVFVLFVDAAHEGGGRRENLVDEYEDGLLGGQLDALPDDVDELAYGEICGYEVLLLINSSDVGLFDLFADDLERRRGRRVSTSASSTMGRGGRFRNDATSQKAGVRRATYGNAVRVFLTDALGLSLALLERVLVLELASHLGLVDGWRRDGRNG